MRLNSLVLRNFRNYVDCEIEFPDRVNLVVGKNAQGKRGCFFNQISSFCKRNEEIITAPPRRDERKKEAPSK